MAAKEGGKVVHKPDRYRQMSEPFPDREAASAALAAFYEELGQLRMKHHIADCYVIIQVNVMFGDKEGTILTSGQIGDQLKAESMAAYAYGKEKRDREELIAQMLSNKAVQYGKHPAETQSELEL